MRLTALLDASKHHLNNVSVSKKRRSVKRCPLSVGKGIDIRTILDEHLDQTDANETERKTAPAKHRRIAIAAYGPRARTRNTHNRRM